jgi:hypothetical protein
VLAGGESWTVHFEDCIEQVGVVATFSGHVHRAVSGDVSGISAMVVPAIATTLRHGRYPAHLLSRPVYQLHRFDPIWGFASQTRILKGPPVSHCLHHAIANA